MGQKTNPIGLRIAVTKDWRSKWYATKKDFASLVVEDNRDMADSLQDFLEGEGCAVRVAYDGPSGLSVAQAQPPQIVFCDIGLPGMDGYAVARAFRTDATLRDVRLVALTGYGQAEDKRRAEQAGFDAHLTKPPDPRLMVNLLAGGSHASDAPGSGAE